MIFDNKRNPVYSNEQVTLENATFKHDLILSPAGSHLYALTGQQVSVKLCLRMDLFAARRSETQLYYRKVCPSLRRLRRTTEGCFFLDAKFRNREFTGLPRTCALKRGTPCRRRKLDQ